MFLLHQETITLTSQMTRLIWESPTDKLIVSVSNPPSINRPTWNVAGDLHQIATIDGLETILSSHQILLNKGKIITLVPYPSTFLFSPVRWLSPPSVLKFHYPPLTMPISNPLDPNSFFPSSSTATYSSYNATTTASIILAANTTRRGFSLLNTGTNVVYIGFANTVSSTNHGFSIAKGALYESSINYTGSVYAISAGGTASVNVIEYS